MNVWGVLGLIKTILQTAMWPGGSTPVFDPASVLVISQGDEIAELDEGLVPPLCVICPMSGDCDPEHREEPDLIRRNIDIILVAVGQGDRYGQEVIMGGHSPGTGQSQGRGLLELEEILFANLKKLDAQQGITIQFAGYGVGQTRRDTSDNFLGIQDYTFQVWTSASLI